jgi:hypothetical protein
VNLFDTNKQTNIQTKKIKHRNKETKQQKYLFKTQKHGNLLSGRRHEPAGFKLIKTTNTQPKQTSNQRTKQTNKQAVFV